MAATGELIRLINYVDDINTTLRRIQASLYGVDADERKTSSREPARGGHHIRERWSRLGEVVAEVRTIAVIGAGTMGRGIAHVAALGGLSHGAGRRASGVVAEGGGGNSRQSR